MNSKKTYNFAIIIAKLYVFCVVLEFFRFALLMKIEK